MKGKKLKGPVIVNIKLADMFHTLKCKKNGFETELLRNGSWYSSKKNYTAFRKLDPLKNIRNQSQNATDDEPLVPIDMI
jgi:hypothetical protein